MEQQKEGGGQKDSQPQPDDEEHLLINQVDCEKAEGILSLTRTRRSNVDNTALGKEGEQSLLRADRKGGDKVVEQKVGEILEESLEE